MSYHNVRTSGDTGAAGLTVWAYTAQFGNGFSGTLSLEAPQGHNRAPVVDVTGGRLLRQRRHRRRQRLRRANGARQRLPDAGHRRQPAGRSGLGLPRRQRRPARLQRRLLPRSPTTSTTAIPPTSSAGRLRLADSSTSAAATRSAPTSATRKALPASAPTPARCWATMPAPASRWGGSRTACSTPEQRSSRPGCGAPLPATSTSGTRSGGRRSTAATSTSSTTAPRPTSSTRTSTRRVSGWLAAWSAGGGDDLHRLYSGAWATAAVPNWSFWSGRYPDAVEPGAAARHRSRPALHAQQHRLRGRGGGGGDGARPAIFLIDDTRRVVGVLPLAA